STVRFQGIEQDLDDLDGMIEEVLTLSRLQTASAPLHLARFPLASLFDELAERARRDPLLANHSLATPAVTLLLTADRVLVARALWNLIENAAKYGRAPVVLRAAETASGE